MRRHRHVRARGDLDQAGELIGGEGRPRGATRPPAVVRVDLDPLRAAADLVARDASQLLDAARLLGALGHRELEPARAVAAGGDDRARHGHDPRSGHDAAGNRPRDPHVVVSRAFGAQVADRREARLQRAARMDHRSRDPLGARLRQHLFVPAGLVVRMEEEMGVGIDQARQERRSRQLDRTRAGRRRDLVRRPGGGDPLAFDDHRPAGLHRLAVEDAIGTQDHRPAGIGRLPDAGACGSQDQRQPERVPKAAHQDPGNLSAYRSIASATVRTASSGPRNSSTLTSFSSSFL